MARVGVEWINRFPAPCSQNTLSYCDDTSVGFLAGMAARGHVAAFNWGDGAAWERDFRDTGAFGGDDVHWADDVDFVHFSSHGGTSAANLFQGFFGSRVDNCTWRSDRARFGDNWNLEYLCIDACNSLELTRDVIAVWRNTFQRLHQIFAFTDLVSDSWWTGGRGFWFGLRAGGNAILSDAWLDECYSFWLDDNPVAMAAGRSQADAINRLNNERVFSGFDDIPNAEIRWFQWKWRS
ncbi:MAG TPA: DUF6345 domain-containing protein [Dehalococcoidia bacterium]|nr:DUF6345 domain-containing protein [Dehalococcoidia bacterium]